MFVSYSPFVLPFIQLIRPLPQLALPDPFAVLTIDGDQTHTTTVMKKTLNPYWNESFDVYVICLLQLVWLDNTFFNSNMGISRQMANSSKISLQVFDQKKFKKKDQGFLGVVNVQMSNVFDVAVGGDGTVLPHNMSF
jgi:E3 ubiquitin-protein ligase NEDD4